MVNSGLKIEFSELVAIRGFDVLVLFPGGSLWGRTRGLLVAISGWIFSISGLLVVY